MKIYELDHYLLSDRYGTYGGAAGSKEGILIDHEYWIVKYPQNTRGMRGDVVTYTTSPLSEYLGSHIYQILGYDVHQTILGIRNNKLVVACKDFCQQPGELREMRTLKNAYNEALEDVLNTDFSSTHSDHCISLKALLAHFDYNPILSAVPGLKARFWNCVVVDGFINNNDRNNGNWGLLYRDGKYSIAPVFDNGAAFSNKITDDRIRGMLANPQKLTSSSINGTTVYGDGERSYNFAKLLDVGLQFPEFCDAIERNVPLIRSSMDKIHTLLHEIPEQYNGIPVCSAERKQFYYLGMEIRLTHLLEPALAQVQKHRHHQLLSDLCADAKAKAAEANTRQTAPQRSAPEHSRE